MLLDLGVFVWCLFLFNCEVICCDIFFRGLVFNYDFFIKIFVLESFYICISLMNIGIYNISEFVFFFVWVFVINNVLFICIIDYYIFYIIFRCFWNYGSEFFFKYRCLCVMDNL